MHELLDDKGPRAMMVQKYLESGGFLAPLREKLEDFSQLAGKKEISKSEFETAYNELLATAAGVRKFIGGVSFGTPVFVTSVVRSLLESAEDEYKEAVEGGTIKVIEPAVPGKDAYLEYQDVRGFLNAGRSFIGEQYVELLNPDAQTALNELLEHQFKSIDPVDAEHPTPFATVEKLLDRVSDGLKQT
jgi:hypothetical protein